MILIIIDHRNCLNNNKSKNSEIVGSMFDMSYKGNAPALCEFIKIMGKFFV